LRARHSFGAEITGRHPRQAIGFLAGMRQDPDQTTEEITALKSAVIVFVGAGVGGIIRHFFNAFVGGVLGTAFPWGIFLINVIGSTVMGLIAEWFALRGNAPMDIRLFLTTGVLGGFTTFSSFSLDTALLYERGQPGTALLYVLASVAASLVGIFAGIWAIRLSVG
jgi:fluoride exporter